MEKKKSLFINTVKYSFSSISSFLLFILLIIAGRRLGANDFGIFTFALALSLVFEPILDPGLYHLLIRETAKHREDAAKLIGHALSWKIIAAPVFFGLIILAVNVIHSDPKTLHAVYLISCSTFLKSIKDVLRASLLGTEKFGLDATSLCIERITLLVIGGGMLFYGAELNLLCWIFVIVRFIDIFVIIGFVRSVVCPISLGYNFMFIKQLLKIALPIGGFYITLNIYNYIDTVMLSALRSDTEVGWYNAGYRIYEGLVILPSILATVFMPRLSWLYKFSTADFNNLVFKGIKLTFMLALIVAANGILVSGKLIPMLYGDDYMKAIPSMKILLFGILFVYVIHFLQTTMITMDKQKIILKLAIIGLILNIFLNIFFIPRFGYLGAALATVLVEIVIFLCLLFVVNTDVDKLAWWSLLGKPIICIVLPFYTIAVFFNEQTMTLMLLSMNLTAFILFFISGNLPTIRVKRLVLRINSINVSRLKLRKNNHLK